LAGTASWFYAASGISGGSYRFISEHLCGDDLFAQYACIVGKSH
jgi:hypothetical protein